MPRHKARKRCQQCYSADHWTYECHNDNVVRNRALTERNNTNKKESVQSVNESSSSSSSSTTSSMDVNETISNNESVQQPQPLQQQQQHETPVKERVVVKRKLESNNIEHVTKKKRIVVNRERTTSATVSIAIPGEILLNSPSGEQRTRLVGQIARAATVFNVDEIVIYAIDSNVTLIQDTSEGRDSDDVGSPHMFMARVLQYLETPPHLRKALFPIHKDLKYVGSVKPLEASHHVSANEDVRYREGVVTKRPMKQCDSNKCYVNVGLRAEAMIDRKLTPGTRVTVEIDEPSGSSKRSSLRGRAVSPSAPRQTDGTYWGYTLRLASGISKVLIECPFDGGYDVCIGVSNDNEGRSVHDCSFELPKFHHALVVFGDSRGLEACLRADDNVSTSNPADMFDLYVNPCANQGSRRMYMEEAVFVTMSALHGHMQRNSWAT